MKTNQKKTTEQVISEFRAVHGDKYDYSKVDYKGSNEKVCIICPKHGEFWILPSNHLNGQGCKFCSIEHRADLCRKTKNEFVKSAIKIHGKKYDYSKVEYKNNATKVCIICPEHGEFWQTPANHISGYGCPKCSHRSYKYSVDEVKKIIHDKYGDKYDTSLIKTYNSNKEKLPLICKKHGLFYISLNELNNNHGCKLCGHEKNYETLRKTLEQFIIDSNKIHGKKYDYSKVNYISCGEKVCIICPKHGEFWQTPNSHLRGCGCPMCQNSRLENEIKNYLLKSNIHFIEKCNCKSFKWLNRQHLDFYLPDYNAAIECQGIQHFEPIEFFGGKTAYKRLKTLDNNKKKLCENQKINLFYYSNVNLNELNGNKVFHDTEELIKNIKALIK